MKLTILLISILFALRVYADDPTDLFEKIQNDLEIHKIDSLKKLETIQLSLSLNTKSNISNFTPTSREFLFECGLYVPLNEPQQILYTLEFDKEIEAWIPINGKSVKTTYWKVSL